MYRFSRSHRWSSKVISDSGPAFLDTWSLPICPSVQALTEMLTRLLTDLWASHTTLCWQLWYSYSAGSYQLLPTLYRSFTSHEDWNTQVGNGKVSLRLRVMTSVSFLSTMSSILLQNEIRVVQHDFCGTCLCELWCISSQALTGCWLFHSSLKSEVRLEVCHSFKLVTAFTFFFLIPAVLWNSPR